MTKGGDGDMAMAEESKSHDTITSADGRLISLSLIVSFAPESEMPRIAGSRETAARSSS